MPERDGRTADMDPNTTHRGEARAGAERPQGFTQGSEWAQQFAQTGTRSGAASLEAVMQMWNAGWGLFFWTQSSFDRMVRMWLDQWRIMLEQMQRMQAEAAEMMGRNQADLQRMTQGAVQGGFSGVAQLQDAALAEMQRRLDELAEQLEAAGREQDR